MVVLSASSHGLSPPFTLESILQMPPVYHNVARDPNALALEINLKFVATIRTYSTYINDPPRARH